MIENIEKLRIEAKISKAKLARDCGISAQMYSRYLNGSQISAETYNKMVKALGYDLIIAKVFKP